MTAPQGPTATDERGALVFRPSRPDWADGCPTGALDAAAVGAALELQRLRAAA